MCPALDRESNVVVLILCICTQDTKHSFCIAALSPWTLMWEYQEEPLVHDECWTSYCWSNSYESYTSTSMGTHLHYHLLKLVGSDIALLHNQKPCCNAPSRSRSKIKAPNLVFPLNLNLYAHIQMYTNQNSLDLDQIQKFSHTPHRFREVT